MTASTPPKRIYKYRAFSDCVLDMLVFDELHFSDPSDFNDPLDTRPHLEPNRPAAELEVVLQRLPDRRSPLSPPLWAPQAVVRGGQTTYCLPCSLPANWWWSEAP